MHRNIPGSTLAGAMVISLALIGITGTAFRGMPLSFLALAPQAQTRMEFDQGFAPVVQRAAPAVVNISSSRIVKTHTVQGVPDDVLQHFFGPDLNDKLGPPKEHREHSLGSGVIVNSGGFVLTNYHIVEDATEVTVSLPDKREFQGKVIGSDPGTDIAILKIDATGLTPIPLADSSRVQVGDIALAIGNPFGLGRTVTMGIVSATGRGGLGIEDYEDFIQTDASVNPGSSGGALTNVRGELIGLNTAILSPSGGNLGIAFAIPSNMARSVMDQILRTGKVSRGFMGLLLQDITPELAEAMNLGNTRGVLVGDVKPDSPAARAGVQAGDVIIEAEGKPVQDRHALQMLIGSMPPGRQISMRLQRQGTAQSVTLTLAETPPEEKGAIEDASGHAQETSTETGLTTSELTPRFREQLGVPAGVKGVVVIDVVDGSAASEAGLEPGDVIQEINRKPVTDDEQVQMELEKAGHKAVLLRVSRKGQTLYVAIK